MSFIFILGLLALLAKVINYLTAVAQLSLFYCLIKSEKYKSILGPFFTNNWEEWQAKQELKQQFKAGWQRVVSTPGGFSKNLERRIFASSWPKMSCCLFKFNNLLIQCLEFSSPGCLLPIKHIIQGVTLLYLGLPMFQAKAGQRGTENFVGMNQVVELWDQIPA